MKLGKMKLKLQLK